MSTAARIDELLSKFDENPRRYFAPLANEYRKAGDLTQAIALCREHLPKQPGHMSGHIVFGQALYEHGDLVEAQTVFEAALALDPENLIALRHLGDIARGRGDTPSARRWYGRVLEADPRNDDIAALLATLPTRATPVASFVVAPEAPPAAETPSRQGQSFVDEPAWHTPTILGATPEPASESVEEARAEPELLDLDSPADSIIEVPTFFGEAQLEASPDASLPLDEAFGAEPEMADTFDALELDAPEVPPAEAIAFEALHIEEIAVEPDSRAHAIETAPDDVAPRDTLSDAIGAFATHDLLESAAASASEPALRGLPDASVESAVGATVEPAPATSERATDFGEGLDDIEWPDASQLSVRTPSPARAATPVTAWTSVAAAPTSDEGESLLELPTEVDDAALTVESLVEAAAELEEDSAFAVESLVEAAAELEEDSAFAVESLVEAAAELEEDSAFAVESLVEAAAELEEDSAFAVESLVEAATELEEDSAFAAPSLLEMSVEVEAESAAAEFVDEALIDVPVASDEPAFEAVAAVEAEVQDVTFQDAARVEVAPSAPMDEDPPFSAGEMPWLMSTEDEREAEEADPFEASELPESPAFVTETMAELLVAQGFVERAIAVYEELVSRRPDDLALAHRLTELRASLTSESVESESVAAEPVAPTFSATPIAPLAAFTPARSSTPPTAFTPARSSTPLAAFTPVRSSTPLSVPFIAPAPRRTAREWLSLLAAMQVARRTPAVGQVVVSMPTPADGLASLFGTTPLPVDDVAARSLATAYGGAVPLDSSSPLFASGEFTLPSESPRESVSASPAEQTNTSGVYSFDRFFPDPATTANGPTASSDAPTASSPTGSATDDPTSPGADLAQFSHWLKGLSNS